MRFDELNEDNYVLFAIKNYENPQAATREDFYEDMRRFKYIKRLLKKYTRGEEIKLSLLLNHIIVLYNVFGEAAGPLLFYKLEREYWSVLKTFIIYLNRYSDDEPGSLQSVDVDDDVKAVLDTL